MILRIFGCIVLLHTVKGSDGSYQNFSRKPCLTGTMVDIQSWTSSRGSITGNISRRESIDLSWRSNPMSALHQELNQFTASNTNMVKYLSMASCGLTSVPRMFQLQDRRRRSLSTTLQYLTFYGNNFQQLPVNQNSVDINAFNLRELKFKNDVERHNINEKSTWDFGFRNTKFTNLRELDLRSCSIQYLDDDVFSGMSTLQSLYLSENNIISVNARVFSKLVKLVHLDLSRNVVLSNSTNSNTLTWESFDVFKYTPHLASLDLSYSQMAPNASNILQELGRNFQRLSLCYTGINQLGSFAFSKTSLRYIDVSGNLGVLDDPKVFGGVEKSLRVVYADSVGLKVIKPFEMCSRLQILKLSNNELIELTKNILETIVNLNILDVDGNKINTWSTDTFSNLENLQVLSLRNNYINVIRSEMIRDIQNVTYIALSSNFFVCSCYARELFEISARNEIKSNFETEKRLSDYKGSLKNRLIQFHTGFDDYYDKISNRNKSKLQCSVNRKNETECEKDQNTELNMYGNFVLFDYNADAYRCLVLDDGTIESFSRVDSCGMTSRDVQYDDLISDGWNKLTMIAFVGLFAIPCLLLAFMFRRNFRYFCITMKNSALMSMISAPDGYNEGTIFHYDVFVSYCNDDRAWVLDHLLPHVERDCNVSVCLHERDFQVGLSILENIVSCIDRSRAIMLIISQRFLLSQWCQFEMHLAQHRLLETRREDLILILLEDIPRRLRPNTLHYLMLTKTYVLWPEETSDQAVFWKRLKKGLVTNMLKQAENVSLA